MGVLCLSTALAAWIGLRAMRRFAPVLHISPGAGWCVLLPSLGFLMVIGAAPTVLAAAGLLALGMVYVREANELAEPRALLSFAGALFAMAALHSDPAPVLQAVPLLALWASMLVCWWGLIFVGAYAPATMLPFSTGTIGAAAIILAAPLQMADALPLAYDAAIILSAFGGLWLVGKVAALPVHSAVRLAMGVLLAYLQLDAIWRGAWMAGAASLVVWLGAIGWGWTQDDRWGSAHAR